MMGICSSRWGMKLHHLPGLPRDEGPIWYAEAGIYIARADDPETFEQYRARTQDGQTIARQVSELPEQSLAGAMQRPAAPASRSRTASAASMPARSSGSSRCGDLQLTAWPVLTAARPRHAQVEERRGCAFPVRARPLGGGGAAQRPVAGHGLQPAVPAGTSAGAPEVLCRAADAARSWPASRRQTTRSSPCCASRFENTGDSPALAELPLAYSPRRPAPTTAARTGPRRPQPDRHTACPSARRES